ncbi:MAG: prepilin-type N-terminal cleavage/methylation domain-containing protein [Verrucomicrobiales bacterium]|nr:prepilin-type N-terminal cleavage/methylation domain-containing protein [Verrucomicrobiales bacterium]
MNVPIGVPLRRGFTMLEILLAISILVIVLGLGSGLALQSIPLERSLNRTASKIEVEARKAAMEAAMFSRDAFLVIHSDSLVGLDSRIEFDRAKISFSHPGDFNSFKEPSSRGYRWKFSANGLCEPLLIRVSQEGGRIDLGFDPLTGEIRDQVLTLFETE